MRVRFLRMSWCVYRGVRNHVSQLYKANIHQHAGARLLSSGPHTGVSSAEVRRVFLQYFQAKDHQFVPSSSVISKRNEGSYFINAGMNQFKPVFLGTVDSGSEMARYHRVTNSQKCIRVGGKHNDLDEVGKDTYHHTFFEMLGSWSFGDYFKMEACVMAWELLTQVYHIPAKHLYVTYFGGDKSLGLEPDLESRDIWLKLGVPANRIIACGMEDNFWEMGLTGPCGPCTEIHYDYQARPDASHLFHHGHPEVVEIWNLVFMQYDRQGNGELKKLPRCHVDTGMGLERLTAVLNGTTSNYDIDLFIPLFNYLHKTGKDVAEYSGKCGHLDYGGVDTAYRIVADHARMFTVALSDGLLPSRRHVGNKLRTVMHRAFKTGHQVLRLPPGTISGLVPLVAESLGEAFPELLKETSQTVDWVDHTELQYIQTIETSRKMLHKALNKYSNSSSHLTGEQIHEIVEGRFGQPVTLDTLIDLSEDYNIKLNLEEYDSIEQSKQREAPVAATESEQPELTLNDLHELAEMKLPPTQDSHKYNYSKTGTSYEFPEIQGKVLALQQEGEFSTIAKEGTTVGIVLDQTCFYAESGGQAADQGQLITENGGVVEVRDVQLYGNYVLHVGQVVQGQLKVGDTVTQKLDGEHRLGCMCGHTATHIINHALESILGGVSQQGSSVTPHRLTFHFSSKKVDVTKKDLVRVQQQLQECVQAALPVYRMQTALSAAQAVQRLRMLHDIVYPSQVTLVSVGVSPERLLADPTGDLTCCHSAELCAGTHVENTADIGAVVITHFSGKSQGVKSLTAITGSLASQALLNYKTLEKKVGHLKLLISKKQTPEVWDTKLADIGKFATQALPKTEKDDLLENLKHLQGKIINEQKKLKLRDNLEQQLEEIVQEEKDLVIAAHLDFSKLSELYKVLGSMKVEKPLLIISLNKESRKTALGVCRVPHSQQAVLSQKRWMARVCEIMGGTYDSPKDKYGKKYLPDSLLVKFNFSDMASLQKTLREAKKYVQNTMKYRL